MLCIEFGLREVPIAEKIAKMKIVPPGKIGPRTCLTPRARVLAAVLLAVPLFAPLMGCWPFHQGPTPQQKFFDALSHGDAVEANQTWLTMSAEDREKLMRGEGLTQRPSPEQIQAAILRHQQGGTTPEVVVPPPAGLQNLNQVLRATPVPPQAP